MSHPTCKMGSPGCGGTLRALVGGVIALALLAAFAAAAQAAMVITYIGEQDGVSGWRTSSVAKTYDTSTSGPAGKDNILGTDGYFVCLGTGSGGYAYPTYFLSGVVYQQNPTFGTFAQVMDTKSPSSYGRWSDSTWGWPTVDVPQTTSPYKNGTINSGAFGPAYSAYDTKPTTWDMFTLTMTADANFRLGLMQDNPTAWSSTLRVYSGAASNTQTCSTLGTGPNWYFWDIQAHNGDVITVQATSATGNPPLMGGATIELPEPATMALLALGGAGMLLRRRHGRKS